MTENRVKSKTICIDKQRGTTCDFHILVLLLNYQVALYITSVSSSDCEPDGTVHNVSFSKDGCQTCTCKVSVSIFIHVGNLNNYSVLHLFTMLSHLIANREMIRNAFLNTALHWIAHTKRRYQDTAASGAEVRTQQ